MSDRHERFDALFLKAKESPAGDRITTMLSPGHGIIDAFVFGGAKSSMRASAGPYVRAEVLIYSDPIKHYRKLEDLSIRDTYSGLRETYARLWSAGVAAELLIKTSGCGGESASMFEMTTAFFDSIREAGDGDAEARLLAYLWKTLDVMGMRPEIDRCSGCGNDFPIDAASGKSRMHFSQGSEGFFCPACGGEKPRLDETLREALSGFAIKELAQVSMTGLDPENVEILKKMVFSFAQTAAEGSLLSLTML